MLDTGKEKVWRPKDWMNPYGTTEFTGHYQLDADLIRKVEKARAFEEGADVMFGAVKGQEDA